MQQRMRDRRLNYSNRNAIIMKDQASVSTGEFSGGRHPFFLFLETLIAARRFDGVGGKSDFESLLGF